MRPSRALIAALVVLALGATAAASAIVYGLAVAPAHRLPRDRAAIEADWARVQPWLPQVQAPGPDDPVLAGLVAPLQDSDLATVDETDALALWLADGGTIPAVGCAMFVPDAPPQEPSAFELFRAGQALAAHDHPEAVLELAAQLREGPLLHLMMSEALVDEVDRTEAGAPGDLFDTLTREIACSDAALGIATPEDLGGLPGGVVIDLETERWKIRDWWARLLLAVHPVRDDREGLRAVVEGFEPPRDALFGDVLAATTLRVARDYLEDPDGP